MTHEKTKKKNKNHEKTKIKNKKEYPIQNDRFEVIEQKKRETNDSG